MDKLEKHIRKKFKEREIAPSAKVWERIDEVLGEEKSSKTRRPLFWAAGVAAGLLVATILSISYWNVEENQAAKVKLVEGTSNKETQTQDIKPVIRLEQEKEDAKIPREENSALVLEEEQSDLKEDMNAPETIQNELRVVENQLQPDSFRPTEVTNTASTINTQIEDKLNEVLAQVTAMENNEITVTDAEIDSLLLAAQQELLVERVTRENGTVDALALLNEVEAELDQTFRDQLFDTLKEGFFKLRTAVADRNN